MNLVLAGMVVWLLTGVGAVGGSILGNAAGKIVLFAGAIAGGLLAAAGAASLVSRRGWINPAGRRRAMLGAMAGFAIAVPIAALNLDGPVIPVLVTGLAGVGAVLGGTSGIEEGGA